MPKIILIFIITFISSNNLFPQELFFCRGYTETGNPIDSYISNKIPVNQSFVILLRAERNEFENNIMILSIEKKEARFNQIIISQILRPDKNKNWLVFNYKIMEEGNYVVTFTDFNRKKIVSSNLTIEKPPISRSADQSTNYFMPNLRIVLCERIINGSPSGILQKISMLKNNGEAYIYLINNMPLKISKLLINIWRKKTPYSDYEEFVDSKKYQVNSEWYDTFFKYCFNGTGEYKINFFNEKEMLLKTTYITVEN